MGPVLYSLSVHSTYAQSIQEVPGAHGLAVIDDFNLICDRKNLVQAWHSLQTNFDAERMPLNTSKCSVFWPGADDPPAQLVSDCKSIGVTLLSGFVVTVGCPIGPNTEMVQDWISRRLAKQNTFFERILDTSIPTQAARAMLRNCGLPRADYISRTCAPPVAGPALRRFDSKCLESLAIRISNPNLADDPAVLSQCHLPIRMGGLGMRSASAANPVAFWAGAAQAVSSSYQSGVALSAPTILLDRPDVTKSWPTAISTLCALALGLYQIVAPTSIL